MSVTIYPFATARIAWSTITGKPTAFPPSAHTHTIADLPVAGAGISDATKLVRADDPRLVADKNFTHNQVAAASVWNVTHNLAKFPSVTVIDSGGNFVVGEVQFPTIDTATLTFNTAFSGQAFFN